MTKLKTLFSLKELLNIWEAKAVEFHLISIRNKGFQINQ